MYVQGASTRKVSKIVESLCGFEVNSMDVSRATQQLDEELEQWRSLPIGKIKYLYIDARYEKVRNGGSVIDCAVLIACGVLEPGHRQLLGVSVSLSEHESHWRQFFESLIRRGMLGVELIISDCNQLESCIFRYCVATMSISSPTKCSSLCAKKVVKSECCSQDKSYI